jgi:hypothetical protein
MLDLEQSRKYWKFESEQNKKAIRVLVNYKLKLRLTNALYRNELNMNPLLSNMEIFRQSQGTNFRVKPAEWQIIRLLLKQKYDFDFF